MENNNYAFIDSQNINLGVRGLGWRLDFARFRVYLSDKYGITKAFLFLGYIAVNEPLYAFLRESGFICVFKPTLILPDGKTKGNIDAELVLHTMIQYPNFDQGLIATGDGDFYCLVEYLQQENKLLKVLIPNQERYSMLLRKFSTPENNALDFMNPLREKLEQNEKGSRRDETLREPLSS
jgi:uncharacterized LabA/DUF88 family protein